MVIYKSFTAEEFTNQLVKIRKYNRLGYFKDCTEDVKRENNNESISEYIYMFDTDNKDVKVLIYSSIEIETKRSRDIGSDAVRLVYRWETKNGVFYKKIKKHLRIDTLFENLEKTLTESCKNCTKLPTYGWDSVGNFEW